MSSNIQVTLNFPEALHDHMKMLALQEKASVKSFYEKIIRLGISVYEKNK